MARFKYIEFSIDTHDIATLKKVRKKVDARTILTYSQYENPTSRWHQDQTKLFAKKRWVKFPFTAREIKRAQLRSFTLKGR